MSNRLFSFLSNWFSTGHSHNVDTDSTNIPSADFGSMFDESPGINPATGLPMISSGGVDVAGNPYGTDLSDDLFSSRSIDSCEGGSSFISHDDNWNSSNTTSSLDNWSSGSGFDDNC